MPFRLIEQTKVDAANGKRFKWTLDIGLLYQGLVLHNNDSGNAIAITDLASLILKINGTPVWTLTGQQLDEINKYDGQPAFDGFDLPIGFGLEGEKDQRMRELTYINTGVASPTNGKIISTFQLELNFANAVDISLYALADFATPDGPGLIRRYATYQKAANPSNFVGIANLDYANAQFAYWRRIFTQCTNAGAVTFQKLYTTKETIWGELVPTGVANLLNKMGNHVTGTFWQAVMDFTGLNNSYNALAKVDSKGGITPDSPSNAMLDTLPYKDKTITLQTSNDGTANVTDEFLLEAVGEID